MWQFQGTTSVCDIHCDLNALDPAVTTVAATPPAPPTDLQVLYALASTAQFHRMGWTLANLHPDDKAALRWLTERL